MPLKTSQSSPLLIAEIGLRPKEGLLGLTTCPGKKDASRHWARDLDIDLKAICNWGASTVITLIEEHEFSLLHIESLGESVRQNGMDWVHLPIRDVDVPDHRFTSVWPTVGPNLHARLDAGQRLLIHCRGGLGRSGLFAAIMLIERGCHPRDAINRVRAARQGAIETPAQEAFVLAWEAPAC